MKSGHVAIFCLKLNVHNLIVSVKMRSTSFKFVITALIVKNVALSAKEWRWVRKKLVANQMGK